MLKRLSRMRQHVWEFDQVMDASADAFWWPARRAALAGTLACATYAVVFDEATSGRCERLQVLHLARELANEGKGFCITHDVSEWL